MLEFEDDEFTVPESLQFPRRTSRNSTSTVFISGLAKDFTDDQLKQVFESYGRVIRAFIVAKKGECEGFGYVVFEGEQVAEQVVGQLDQGKLEIQGNFVTVKIAKEKKKLPEEEKEKEKEKEKKDIVEYSSPGLLVRGLGENIDAKKLFKRARKLGNVVKVFRPAPESEDSARIIFATAREAVEAKKKLDGKEMLGCKLEALFLAPKAHKLIVRNLPFGCKEEDLKNSMKPYGHVNQVQVFKGFGFVLYRSVLGSVQAILASEKQETKVGERIVAVDWALPKDAFIQQRDKEQKKSEKVESSVGKESQSAVDSDHESENESDNSNVSESEDEDEEDEAADDSESDEEMTDVVEKQRFDDVNERRTVFVRNLPYSISSQEIRSTFEQFGTVKSVSMTKTTLANGDIAFKGTAFVEFSSAEEAENAIQKSAIPTDAIPEKLRKKKSDALKSIALEGVGGLWIQNRLINVSLAISRAQAHELADQSSDLNKRNMNLAQEGLILENSSAAKDVSKSDLERRAKLWKETKTKLTLPNYTVSKVRLSVHNLPLKFTESELSELFSKSVNGKEFRIVQTKIIRDKLRIDNDTGLGRSKRYGFVEFSSHDDALAALRALNNNPNVWGKSSRPIVSFAIDDSRKLHIRELKRQASKRKHKMVQEEDSSSSNKKRKSVNLAWTKEHPNAKSNLKKSKKSKASLF